MCHKERQNTKCRHIYEEFHIKPILDVIREGKFRWLGHVLRREPPSMLHEVVNYKGKGKIPRWRPRTTWLKSMDKLLNEKGSCMKHVMSQNLYQDRCAWRTLFVDWQEFIFLTGDWFERERESNGPASILMCHTLRLCVMSCHPGRCLTISSWASPSSLSLHLHV